MGKKYKVNPICPYCKEKHEWWTIAVTDEEQIAVDDFYEEHKFKSGLVILLEINNREIDPPLVHRNFKCQCGTEFETNVLILRENEVKEN